MQRWSNKMAEPLRILMRRGVLFVMVTIMAVITSLSPFVTQPANAAVGDFSLGGNSCAVETVGWVLCPTMRSIARLADKGFVYINQESLSIQYSLFGGNSRTFTTWEIMRNIANALFVIVFLYIIYTYLVGRNGGYSFKRLLPRLLIAAIAVNLSYYLGVILVDISNIVGDSLWEIMKNIYGSGNSNPVMPLGGSPRPEEEGNITKMAAAVMGSTGMVWALLPPLAIVSISVAVISAAMVILVIMREALVATLILASPVLIVLYLLPNLERFASQAMQLFIQLLILYPIIAVLLGTGQIVSLAAGSWGVESTFYGGGSTSVVPDLIAAAAAVVPLLGIWFVFKNLSSVMSSAGSRLSASIKSRGGKDDKDARVTGKATAGAAAVKNTAGLGNPLGRKSAFNRNRRRKSLGGSALANEGGDAFGDKGLAARRANSPFEALQNALSGGAEKDTKKQDELKGELAGAEVNAENPNEVNLEKAAAESLSASMDGKNDKQQPDKPKTAKDIFNNLNRGHEAKDKDRLRIRLKTCPRPSFSNDLSGFLFKRF